MYFIYYARSHRRGKRLFASPRHARPPVYMRHCGSHWTDFHAIFGTLLKTCRGNPNVVTKENNFGDLTGRSQCILLFSGTLNPRKSSRFE
jgi:hypothetical protein